MMSLLASVRSLLVITAELSLSVMEPDALGSVSVRMVADAIDVVSNFATFEPLNSLKFVS